MTPSMPGALRNLRRPIALLAAVALTLVGALLGLAAAADAFNVGYAVAAVAVLFLAYGLFRQRAWACRTLAAICVFFAMGLPFMLFNPFGASDAYAAGREPLDVYTATALLVFLEVVLLGATFALDPRRDEPAALP